MSETIETLAARLTRLEDHQAIADLIASYGPAVDTLDGARAASLWSEDGTYRIGPDAILSGRDEIAGIAEMDQHRSYVDAGCAHILSPHRIRIDGARAVAQGYSLVMLHEPETGHWRVERCSANLWRLRKWPEGWQVIHRQADLLTGAEHARALLNWANTTKDVS